MPNYVTSRCRIVGPEAEIARFKALAIRTAPEGHSDAGGLLFDFDAIIPMPPMLREAEASTAAEEGMALIEARGDLGAPFATLGLSATRIAFIRSEAGLPADAHISDVAAAFLANNPQWEEQGSLRMRALIETGFANWYPWAIANWGTKWGSFRYFRVAEEPDYWFGFETAWSFPTPVFEKLAREFPQLAFDCVTFDEGWNFAGEGWFNPPEGAEPFKIGDACDRLYEAVYGNPPPEESDEDDAA